jgi:cobalamin biosynthesis Mg chelatase CobN
MDERMMGTKETKEEKEAENSASNQRYNNTTNEPSNSSSSSSSGSSSYRSGSSYEATGTGEPSNTKNTRSENVLEIQNKVEKESRCVFLFRTLLIGALLVVGAALSGLTYYVLHRNAQQDAFQAVRAVLCVRVRVLLALAVADDIV